MNGLGHGLLCLCKDQDKGMELMGALMYPLGPHHANNVANVGTQ